MPTNILASGETRASSAGSTPAKDTGANKPHARSAASETFRIAWLMLHSTKAGAARFSFRSSGTLDKGCVVKMELPIYQVDAFASALFRGNPAAVCPLEEWLPDQTLQNIAAENNLSETAYYVRKGERYDLR